MRSCAALAGAPGDKRSRSAPWPSIPRHSKPLRRRGDDAETRASAGHDRNVDGEFVPSGQQFAGAVERVDQDEARRNAGRRAQQRGLFRHDATPGSRRARPSRITASAAWSAAVTGEWSALVRASSESRARRRGWRAAAAETMVVSSSSSRLSTA